MSRHLILLSTSKRFCILLFALITFSTFSQTKRIDSLQLVLKNAVDKQKITTLLELCWSYRFINADTARQYGLAALALAKSESLLDLEAEALNYIGVTHEAQGNYSEALTYELPALELRRKLGDDSKTANTLNALGIVYDEKGDYEKALLHYYEARKIYEGLNDQSKIAMVLTNIGIVLKAQKEYKKVITYYRQAMDIYQKLGNQFGLAACHSNLGAVYLKTLNYDSSIYYSLLAGKEFEEQNIKQFLPTAYSNAAIAFDKIDQLEKAKIYFLRARKLHEEYKNKKELSYTLSQLARLESKQGNANQAIKYAEEALTIAQNIKALEQIMQAHEALAESSASAADFSNAYKEHIRYTTFKDSLFQLEKSKQLVGLQLKYETEKKDNQIIQLSKDNQIKTAAIERNYLLFGSLASVLLLTFLFWRYRNDQKQKSILQEQKVRLREAQISAVIESQENERKRFASDLHDGMGQLVTSLQLTIQSIKGTREPAQTLSLVENSEQLLSDIQSEIRNIAFNLMPPILVKEGLVPATRELIRRVNKASPLKVNLAVHEVPNRFTNVVEISLYRIIQELISNTLKYNSANELSISFTGHEKEVILTIEDNGIGYDLAKFQNNSQSNGWSTIQSRINLIKGNIEFDVVAGRKNNTVIIQIPTILSQPVAVSLQNT